MRSNKGGIIAWLIFILVIVIAFGTLYYFRSISPTIPTDGTEVSEEVITPKKKFTTKEISEEKKAEIDSAALEDALSTGSIEDCEKITYDDALKQKCLDSLGYAVILRSGDEIQCEKLFDKELKQQCLDKIYYSDAMDTMDTSLCKKISDESLKQRCLDQIQVIMGKNAESTEDCDSILDIALKQECLNNYYYSSSIKELDEESCDNITNSQLRDLCTTAIADNLKADDVAEKELAVMPQTTQEVLVTCDNYQGEQSQECKDDANYELAFEEKDISYCNRILDTSKQKECIDKQGDSINQYYFRQGTTYGDASMCEKITNTSLKILCLDLI